MNARLVTAALLALVLLVSAIGAVYVQHLRRTRFVELRALEREADALQVEWGRLQLEESTWAGHDRVEKLARSRLGLSAPRPEQTVVVVVP